MSYLVSLVDYAEASPAVFRLPTHCTVYLHYAQLWASHQVHHETTNCISQNVNVISKFSITDIVWTHAVKHKNVKCVLQRFLSCFCFQLEIKTKKLLFNWGHYFPVGCVRLQFPSDWRFTADWVNLASLPQTVSPSDSAVPLFFLPPFLSQCKSITRPVIPLYFLFVFSETPPPHFAHGL